MLLRKTFRGALALVGASAVALSMSACIMTGEDDYARQQEQSSSAASTQQAESTPTGVDLSSGGACAGGEDAFVNGADLEVTVTGDCGSIRVEGTNITATVDNATSIAIRGEGNSVTGTEWDSVTIQGINLTATVKTASAVEVNGKGITVNASSVGTINITGDTNAMATGDITAASLQGTNLSLTAAAIAESLTVEGSNNTVTWSGGIDKETSASGENNTLTRE